VNALLKVIMGFLWELQFLLTGWVGINIVKKVKKLINIKA